VAQRGKAVVKGGPNALKQAEKRNIKEGREKKKGKGGKEEGTFQRAGFLVKIGGESPLCARGRI